MKQQPGKTRGDLRRARALRVCLWAVFCGAAVTAQEGVVRTLTGNDIYDLECGGDTLWMTTDAGINYTVDVTSDSIAWWGYRTTAAPWGVTFGGGGALAILSTDDFKTPNSVFCYNHSDGSHRRCDLPWDRANLAYLADSTENNTFFTVFGARWSDGFHWLAGVDAGLVRWDVRENTAVTMVPGIDRVWPLETFPQHDDSLMAAFPDTTRRVTGVTGISSDSAGARIAAVTAGRIWVWSIADSAWDSLAVRLSDSTRRASEFFDVFADRQAGPPAVYASLKSTGRTGQDADTAIYKYESGARAWYRFGVKEPGQRAPQAVAFAQPGYVYVADEKNLYLYRDSAGTAHLPLRRQRDAFRKRMEGATGEVFFGSLRIRDVAVTPAGGGAFRLWIGTSEGLFFSRAERPDAYTEEPFLFIKRSVKIAEGLKHAYAVPGILTRNSAAGASPRAVFAYNLARDGRVSIAVYDWNMDLVRTVVDAQPRVAGSTRPMGRSTDPNADYWDGTSESGRTVAPGVYYFKISTDNGERAFGRIIVALSR